MRSIDKIIVAVIVLISGIHCSGTNASKEETVSPDKSTLPEKVKAASDSSMDGRKAAVIDHFFKNRNAMGQFSGAFLFYDNGHYYANAYGYANGKLKTKLKPEMPFQIASASKTLTAFAILTLIDQKKLGLHTHVHEVLQGFPYDKIDISHLLSHKSGIPNYMYFAETYYKNKYRHLTNSDVLWMLKRYRPKLEFKPDSRYKYSNTNYVLLALIVEKLSGKPFEEYMETAVFKAMGMHNSYVFHPGMSLSKQTVQGHNGTRSIFPEFYQNGTMGDKGVYTNVFDLLKFDRTLRKHTLLSKKTLRDACTPHTPCRPTKDYYGYGWRIRYYDNGDTIVYHNGWWQGFKSYFVRWQNKDKCIIVLANTVSGGFIKQTDLMMLMDGQKPKAVTGILEED